jgi:Uma2 family endonuclease
MGKAATTRAQPNYEKPPRRVGKLYEVVDGKFVEPKPMGALETWIAWRLSGALSSFLDGKRLGTVGAEMLFLLQETPRLERRPDVAFVSNERWDIDRPPERSAWNVIPDLAVEVVSPSNSATEIFKKVTDYFQAGVKRVWVIYPDERSIQDYASLDEIRIVRGEASLEGGEILPGFSITLADLFGGIRNAGDETAG